MNTDKPKSNLAGKELPKLTKKQQAFVTHILEHPKDSYAEAARKTYNPSTNGVARAIASENLTKPNIQMALGIANNEVEQVLKGVVTDWGFEDNTRKREIAVNTAQWIHDKIHGKAIQQMNVTSTQVSLTIDMTASEDV